MLKRGFRTAVCALALAGVVTLQPTLSDGSPATGQLPLRRERQSPTIPLTSRVSASDTSAPQGSIRRAQARADDWLDRVEFTHLSVEDGLSQSSVNAVLQDSRGFIWFGTDDGLNRYDGYQMVVYHADPVGKQGLSHNTVTALAEDRSGHLWVGTSGGLDRLKLATGSFEHFRHAEDDETSLADDGVLALSVDRRGDLWIGTGSGLDRLGPDGDGFDHYAADGADPGSLPDNHATSIYEDSLGDLWIGTWQGVARWDPGRERFRAYVLTQDQGAERGRHAVRAIVENPPGTLWVAASGSGLFRLEGDATAFEQVTVGHHEPTRPLEEHVTSLWVDASGLLWVGTNGRGLHCLDPGGKTLASYAKDPRASTSLSSNYVNAIYQSRHGVLWVGTAGGGVSTLDRDRRKFVLHQADPTEPASLGHDHVLALCGDDEGAIWVGTDGGGLDRLDPRAGTFSHFRHDREDPYSLSNNVISALHRGSDGDLWIGTWGGGIARFDREAGHFVHFQADPFDPHSLSSNWVHALHQDQDGWVWIGTTAGLERLDRDLGRFVNYWPAGGDVTAIREDADRNLWFATGSGVGKLDRASGQVTRYAPSIGSPGGVGRQQVQAIHQDGTGRIWLGTAGGLCQFDPLADAFTCYTERDGLADDVVMAIREDVRGRLWISTAGGLSRFDPTTGVFRNYDVSDGLQGYEFTHASCRGGDGTLYFGGINGLNSFDPEAIADNPFPPPVYLTSLTQDGRPRQLVASDNGFHVSRLRWPNNGFEFSFVALNYHQPEKNLYAYQLRGFDRDWNQVGAQRFGRYTNLPGGTYQLQIKASNNDGVWNEEGITVPITVVPPVWATWWFRGTALILAASAVVAGYRLRVRSVRNRSRELEALAADRTAALSRANEQLKQEMADRKRAEEALAQKAAEAAVAAERSRLARDLHDAVTQLLFSASLIAEALPAIWENNQEEGRELLAEMRRLSRGALAEMRTLLLELRPAALTETGLVDLLRQLAEAAAGRSDLNVHVTADREPELPRDVHIALYRIAQEALNNVIKHARASEATISLRVKPCQAAGGDRESVHLSIEDDGCGFDPGRTLPDHMGLAIIRERAERVGAILILESQPNQGTQLIVSWRDER